MSKRHTGAPPLPAWKSTIDMRQLSRCWCGNADLQPFSGDYWHCPACETLVLAELPEPRAMLVEDDERDFYGKHYFEVMARDHGLPPLEARARADLSERCLHWLRGLVKYKLPPARVLEIGCAHGGFVAMMRWAGFDAVGLDLSPGLTQWARETFDIPVLTGPIEAQTVPPGSLDAVVLMDVLEHLPDPEKTLRVCVDLLNPDGILFFQTPQYREGTTFEELTGRNDPFLKQLKAEQHLYLFSQSSIRLLLRKIGCEHVCFERAIFSFYDMSLVASRGTLGTFPEEEAFSQLLSRPSARLPTALLDLDRKFQALTRHYTELEAAHISQSGGLEQLRQSYAESEADRAVRLQNMITLEKWLAAAQADLLGKQELLVANQAHLGELEGSKQLLAKQYEARFAAQDACLREIEISRQLLAGHNDSLQHRLSESQRRVDDLQLQVQQGAAIREKQAHLLNRIRHSYVFSALRRLGLWRWLDPLGAEPAPANAPQERIETSD